MNNTSAKLGEMSHEAKGYFGDQSKNLYKDEDAGGQHD